MTALFALPGFALVITAHAALADTGRGDLCLDPHERARRPF